MAQCRPNTALKRSLRLKSTSLMNKDDSGCDTCPEESLIDSCSQDTEESQVADPDSQKTPNKTRSSINLRSTNRGKADPQPVPDVGETGSSPTIHSNMKTKQLKEESDKSIDEDTAVEPKTRARKKASDINEEEKNKLAQDEPKTSKEPKRNVTKPKAIVKKKPLGIRKTLRSKKATVVVKDKLKNVIKQTVRRGKKTIRAEVDKNPTSQEKDTVPLIPASEIKKEPVDDTTPNSRSSSPKTSGGRRQRLSSDLVMMKSVLADTQGTLVLGPRTSPYSMRSERSNSPSLFDGKNLRSGKPRKVKNNLLNEVVMKEQKKRRRLLSDSKAPETVDEEMKKSKRGRSCSRDGSEISKCGSDITESDTSLSETLMDVELNKKLDKSKTDLDVDNEHSIQISTIPKVPSLNVESKSTENKQDTEPSSITKEKNKKKLSLNRSTSLDSDNNNSDRIKLDNLNSSDVELPKTDNDTLLEARSSILDSMSKTFNSKEMSKNMRRARRGRKVAATPRAGARTGAPPAAQPGAAAGAPPAPPAPASDPGDDKEETLETLSKDIDDLINNLDQNIDCDREMCDDLTAATENSSDEMQTKSVSKFYGLSKPLGDNNSIITPDTPMKEKDAITTESTPSKNDDSENIRLHYEEDSMDRSDNSTGEIIYKCTPTPSIDKLMDRLKEFEEFDKKRQRQESESSKSTDGKTVMVTNDVVLIPKSGADPKSLKDIQPVRSPEKPIDKGNLLSCFENNAAISIVKRDQVRKSIDIEVGNSVTIIKRNSISARKESTSSNHSRESDAITKFEKSLGKDVTLTEIRKSSVDKGTPAAAVEILQFTSQSTTPTHSVAGVVIDPNQISITPRSASDKTNNDHTTKHKPRDSLSRKSSESGNETEEKLAAKEKLKSPPSALKSPAISITPAPVAVKSPEVAQPMETEVLPPPIDTVKTPPEDISLTTEIAKLDSAKPVDSATAKEPVEPQSTPTAPVIPTKQKEVSKVAKEVKMDVEPVKDDKVATKDKKDKAEEKPAETKETKPSVEQTTENKVAEVVTASDAKPPAVEVAKPVKGPGKGSKSARNSTESLPGPSSMLHESPESQKRKENVLRTLGLLTHKAAKEAKIEKLKEKERMRGYMMNNKSKAKSQGDYTGTLKTVIKLNRSAGERDKKKYRSSLKMTFQKSKHRGGKPAPEVGEAAGDNDAYYTIERREIGAGASTEGGHRKSHYSNRLNNHDAEAVPEPEPTKESANLVIPEKASSFSIHPGRLCMDQCFYCGGKFGLFDTPCHIAQMKSSERQKKVLDNEEKLTIDSCLCDACYRHVDRRANCPSYRKRPAKPPPALDAGADNTAGREKVSPGREEEEGGRAVCHTEGCSAPADHSIRRKWLIKMRSSVSKILQLEGDYPGLHTLPLCSAHHAALAALMECALCRRALTKHHNSHLMHHGYTELNPLLSAAGVPVEFRDKPVLCKLCRYYCTLLQRPDHNVLYARAYRKRLLQIHNVEIPSELQTEGSEARLPDDALNGKGKKKTRAKSKQRKSSDPDKPDSSSSDRRSTSPRKEDLEEDIESLISSNKILVPGAVPPPVDPSLPSDGSENDPMAELEGTLLPFDKQTELQYLLQRQNNPAQFIQNPPNLTQKQKSILKLHNLAGIQKPGQQQRTHDKNAKKIQKVGQMMQKDKTLVKPIEEPMEVDKSKDSGVSIIKNISLNEECTIESVPTKKSADINTLKNKWQMSESFTQVKKNLSELSKKLSVDKEPKKQIDGKYSNPVKRLETNPSISVRELFPGEEEMNLQCNIEFGNVKGVTPEGWEKCNTMIQYDVETKRLWNELQRPYGNQSSFLRHLILLEKYFRSGDLVLSHSASPHAANYSDSVQSRLRAYDNVINDTPRRAEPAISLIEFRKKPAVNGKSLLKSNQTSEADKDPKKSMPPPVFPKPKPKADKAKKTLPPELIAINTPNSQGRKAIQNVLHNIQQLVKGVSASDPTEIAAAPLPIAKFEPPKEKKEMPKLETAPKKQKTTSKPWRPTLMAITQENLAKIAREPTQVAVDGRSLPSLVQVMSSGKRYHITLQDYNKMCVMRREKLQQLHDGEANTKRLSTDGETVVTEVQTSAMLGNGGTVLQNLPTTPTETSPEKKESAELQIGTNAATILKNVGLKNITIAPITPKTATVTSLTAPAAAVATPAIIVTSGALKIPQLGPAVSITSELIPSSPLTPVPPPPTPLATSSPLVMPKIPKSLTVIPQSVPAEAGGAAPRP